jgi:hypothetical protein
MANGHLEKAVTGGDWKVWAIRLGFGIIAGLLPVTLSLAALSYHNMKEAFTKDITRIERSLQSHATLAMSLSAEQGKKIDQLCQKVQDHDTWLRMPFNQRKELFMYPAKYNNGQGNK